jgi:hypothetical protein
VDDFGVGMFCHVDFLNEWDEKEICKFFASSSQLSRGVCRFR